ncbi:MAG: phenylacetate-CoA oxygenase subunit PaaC [Thalassobaculaceae bacterium]|nr:phenylacetate-CoA oxygenase subunit PaaC [Thalassobaculaceae bacterium]
MDAPPHANRTHSNDALFAYTLRLGDNCLVLAQRLSAWVGHAPALEEDIAVANVALDMVGQAQLWLALAADLEGQGRNADDLAYGRDAGAFRNLLLVEQPNGDYAKTLMRQFLFDAWHHPMLVALAASSETRIAEIAAKAAKEAAYHLTRSRDLVVSLGDGTGESHDRMQAALATLWPYTGEMVLADPVDEALAVTGAAPDLATLAAIWSDAVGATLTEATLVRPADGYAQRGGKQGVHSEHLGYMLAEMQFVQRAYPGGTW